MAAEKISVHLRGIDADLHRLTHAQAIELGMPVGEAYNAALRKWLGAKAPLAPK